MGSVNVILYVFCIYNSRKLRRHSHRLRATVPNMDEICFFSATSRPTLGPTRPPIQRVPEALSPRIKWQGREADQSSPSSAEVKKGRVIPAPLSRPHKQGGGSDKKHYWHFLRVKHRFSRLYVTSLLSLFRDITSYPQRTLHIYIKDKSSLRLTD
jgi:hypothetical protein